MADIELVIKISEEEYKLCKKYKGHLGDHGIISDAIANGIPLPKGQGVSLESLDEDAKETVSHLVECYEDDCFTNDERVTLACIALQARLRYQLNKYMEQTDGKDENNKI